MKKYKVTCTNCKQSDSITILQGRVIDWSHSTNEYILSGRQRLDNQWGWQCRCGNNDILTKQEQRQITNKQNPDPQEIAEIVKNLVPDNPRFTMIS